MAGIVFPLTPAYPCPYTIPAKGTYKSAAFDITGYSRLNLELYVQHSPSTHALTVDLEATFDPSVGGAERWQLLGLNLQWTQTAAGVLVGYWDMAKTGGLAPYIRLVASLPDGASSKQFLAKCVARE